MNEFDDKVLDLLDQWLEAQESGGQLSVEELCKDRPDLIETIKARIDDLKATEWLEDKDDELDPESLADFGLPEKLGRYKLVRLLGEGGFGQVWEGDDPVLHRKVAIKLPRRDRFSPTQLKSFIAEAKRIAALKQHPGIVPIYDVGKSDDLVFIVSEFVEAKNLAELSESRRFPNNEVREIICKAADVLSHAHEKGFIHRDIKPSNILLSDEGRLFLTDFGIAASPEELEGKRTNIGTLTYMSPEQEAGQKLDHRSDIYSLGLVMLVLLTGEIPPFGDDRLAETDKRISSLTCDNSLKQVVRKCLAAAPDDRFDSAAQVRDALEVTPRRNRFVGAILLVGILTGAFFLWRPDHQSAEPNQPSIPSQVPSGGSETTQVESLESIPDLGPKFLSITSTWNVVCGQNQITLEDRENGSSFSLDVPTEITAVNVNESQFAFGSEDGLIRVRSLEADPKERFVLDTKLNEIQRIAFNPNGDALACYAEGGAIQIWNLTTRPPRKAELPPIVNSPSDMKFIEDELLILTNAENKNGEIWIWEVDLQQAQIHQRGFVEVPNLAALVSSDSGKTLLVKEGKTARVLELVRLAQDRFRLNQLDEFYGEGLSLPKFARDDLLVFHQSGSVQVRDVVRHETRTLDGLGSEVRLLDVHGNDVVVVDDEGDPFDENVKSELVHSWTFNDFFRDTEQRDDFFRLEEDGRLFMRGQNNWSLDTTESYSDFAFRIEYRIYVSPERFHIAQLNFKVGARPYGKTVGWPKYAPLGTAVMLTPLNYFCDVIEDNSLSYLSELKGNRHQANAESHFRFKEWQTLEITCLEGEPIEVRIDGEVVNRAMIQSEIDGKISFCKSHGGMELRNATIETSDAIITLPFDEIENSPNE